MWSLVQRTISGNLLSGSQTATLPLPQATGEGNVIVIGLEANNPACGPQTIEDVVFSAGGDFIHPAECACYDSGGHATDIALTLACVGGSTSITVTRNAKNLSSPWKLSAAEYSCSNGPAFVDAAGHADDTTSGSEVPGVALSLAGSNDVVYQIVCGGGGMNAVTPPYDAEANYSDHFGAVTSLNTVDGSAPVWTSTGAGRAAASAIAIAEGPQPPGIPTPPPLSDTRA